MAKKSEVINDVAQEEQVVPTVEETVVEKPYDGQPTRAYRSFAYVPLECRPDYVPQPQVDGGQEEA